MKKLKVYIAGKVSPDSVFGTHDWRDAFCQKLGNLAGFDFINLDPTKSSNDFDLDEGNAKLIFGRDCFMIKSSDFVIVNLTDDISVGGSQEMLIAKYYKKPLVGIAPKGGKFYKEEKEILGRVYKNWKHAFVAVPCDVVVENIEEVAKFVKDFFAREEKNVKDMTVIDDAETYYVKNYLEDDTFVKNA